MAIQLDITFHTLSIPAAYVRIDRFVFTSKFECRAYAMVFAKSDGTGFLRDAIVDFVYDPDAKADIRSLHVQAYAALKALPEFAGSVDV